MKPKTKAEPKVQIKLSVAKSLADACAAARQEASDTPYDWNATMAEALDKPSWNAARMAVARALIRLAHELKNG